MAGAGTRTGAVTVPGRRGRPHVPAGPPLPPPLRPRCVHARRWPLTVAAELVVGSPRLSLSPGAIPATWLGLGALSPHVLGPGDFRTGSAGSGVRKPGRPPQACGARLNGAESRGLGATPFQPAPGRRFRKEAEPAGGNHLWGAPERRPRGALPPASEPGVCGGAGCPRAAWRLDKAGRRGHRPWAPRRLSHVPQALSSGPWGTPTP